MRDANELNESVSAADLVDESRALQRITRHGVATGRETVFRTRSHETEYDMASLDQLFSEPAAHVAGGPSNENCMHRSAAYPNNTTSIIQHRILLLAHLISLARGSGAVQESTKETRFPGTPFLDRMRGSARCPSVYEQLPARWQLLVYGSMIASELTTIRELIGLANTAAIRGTYLRLGIIAGRNVGSVVMSCPRFPGEVKTASIMGSLINFVMRCSRILRLRLRLACPNLGDTVGEQLTRRWPERH